MNKMNLKEKYEGEVRKMLMKEWGEKNMMAVPKLTKIVVNMGTGDKLKNKELAKKLMDDLAAITGQKPQIKAAKISVAGFGIREGNPVGLSVTLRRDKMYDFLERLIKIVLPRLRDFRGVPIKSIDQSGNYTLGLADYSVFPEVDMAKTEGVQGLEITLVTNTRDKKQAKRLLELLGMPFEKED